MKSDRRKFLLQSTIAGTALAMRPLNVLSAQSPSDMINVAVMGVRSRGLALALNFAQQPNTRVGYVCDVDEEFGDDCIRKLADVQAKAPRKEKDIRKVLEDQDVDAVVIAAPDHWHAPAAIMAMSAGKHVYLEKKHPFRKNWISNSGRVLLPEYLIVTIYTLTIGIGFGVGVPGRH